MLYKKMSRKITAKCLKGVGALCGDFWAKKKPAKMG
jgi:hypothetical protein